MGKYEEALERAKELHEAGNALTKSQMEIVFPELKESKHERIREELIGHCKDLVRMNRDDKVMLSVYEPWLVWLEKQKDSPMPEDTVIFQKGVAEGRRLEREEQQPAEWSKEDEFFRQQLIIYCENCVQDTLAAKCVDWLKSLCPQPHWKPSEEQMAILEKVTEYYYNNWTGATIREQKTLASLYDDLQKQL